MALQFASGAVGTLQLTSQRAWWRNYDRVEITGQGEYLVLDGLWGFRHYTRGERSTELGGDGAALTEFVAAIREGRAPLTSIHDAVETMRIYQALWDSFEAGRAGMLALDDQRVRRVSRRPTGRLPVVAATETHGTERPPGGSPVL